MSLLALIKYLELATGIVGLLYFKKYSNTFLRYFLYMLWVVIVVEFTISFLKQHYEIKPNHFIYNVLTSVQYVYYYLLYYKMLRDPVYRKWVKGFLIIFVVSVVINFVQFQKLDVTTTFHSHTFTIGAILLIATIGFFLIEILNNEKVLYFKRYLMFWISIGLFVFYTGIIPFVLSLNFLPALLSWDTLAINFFTLNFVMYACFTIGFILSRPDSTE
jgi:hypothetical protein